MKANKESIIQSAMQISRKIVLSGVLGFVGTSTFSLGLVVWLLPETRGRTLEELELELAATGGHRHG